MKTLKGFMKALRVKPIYAEDFSNREDVFSNFAKAEDKDIQICYAIYEPGDYCGDALVLYYRKSTKKYYQAYGSHCSCYGLEDQWTGDEEISFEELNNRIKNGDFVGRNILKEKFEEYVK